VNSIPRLKRLCSFPDYRAVELDYNELLMAAAAPLVLIVSGIMLAIVAYDLSVRVWATVNSKMRCAEQKAASLLREWLSPLQRAQYDKEGEFEVRGCHSGKRYRIPQGRQTNVIELDEQGSRVGSWCFRPEGELTTGDIRLAQKIALETNERAALEIANRFR
jgi:hypothetical protein